MKYTTIFFDLDDTLIDTLKSGKEGLKDLYDDYNWDNYFTSFEDFHAKYQRINLHLWDLYEHNQIDKETLKTKRFQETLSGYQNISAKQSIDINRSFMERVSSKKNIIEGAIEILEYLRPNYQMYILSNGFVEVQDQKIQKAGMHSFFDQIILSDHVGKNKPHPSIFQYALKKANADNKDVIMIGDNIKTDIIGAKNSNIDQVWFNPKNKPDDQQVQPTFQITTLNELKTIL